MNIAARKASYKLVVIKCPRIHPHQTSDQSEQDSSMTDIFSSRPSMALSQLQRQYQPPHSQLRQNIHPTSNINLFGVISAITTTTSHAQEPASSTAGSTSKIPYALYVLDDHGTQYPLSIYPISRGYAFKEMERMEEALLSQSGWPPEVFRVVQRAVEELNDKDDTNAARTASQAAAQELRSSGGFGGGSSSGAGSSGRGVRGAGGSSWEICGYREDHKGDQAEWAQITVLVERMHMVDNEQEDGYQGHN